MSSHPAAEATVFMPMNNSLEFNPSICSKPQVAPGTGKDTGQKGQRGAPGGARREDSHSRARSKRRRKAPLATQLVSWPLGKAPAQRHCLL